MWSGEERWVIIGCLPGLLHVRVITLLTAHLSHTLLDKTLAETTSSEWSPTLNSSSNSKLILAYCNTTKPSGQMLSRTGLRDNRSYLCQITRIWATPEKGFYPCNSLASFWLLLSNFSTSPNCFLILRGVTWFPLFSLAFYKQ